MLKRFIITNLTKARGLDGSAGKRNYFLFRQFFVYCCYITSFIISSLIIRFLFSGHIVIAFAVGGFVSCLVLGWIVSLIIKEKL